MRNRLAVAAVTLVTFVAVILFGELPKTLLPPLADLGRALGPYGYAMILNAIGVVVPIAVVSLQRRSFTGALRDLGFLADPIRPLIFGVVATSPAWVGFLITAPISHGFTAREFILLCWLFPLSEEVTFRAYAFGQLNGPAGWRFWPAALVPAVVFGACHLYQSRDPAELAGIFAITAVGSVVFSFFFARFGRNLWAPVVLHALMNTWWMIFTTNQNALGGLADNIFRFGSIGLALGLAYAATRVRGLGWLIPASGDPAKA